MMMRSLLLKTAFSVLVVAPLWGAVPAWAAPARYDEALTLKVEEETQKLRVNVVLPSTKDVKYPTYRWTIPSTMKPIFFQWMRNLAEMEERSASMMEKEVQVKDYRGLEIELVDYNGAVSETLTLYKERVRNAFGDVILRDWGRRFEYWVWSTSDEFGHQRLATMVLPVYSFGQCLELGNPIIETTPRQCLLANGEIFLEVSEKPTPESLTISNFDECLVKGQALINTFPRRCIAAGGHVYTEPPRLLDARSRRTPQLQGSEASIYRPR